MFIAANYLENIKAESDFIDVPAGQLIPSQCEELVARYNGGPDWQSPDAQRYAHEMMATLDKARGAL
jgi:hypothetical protein